MDTVITDLVNRFELGKLTRRELIQGLSALVAAGATSTAAAQASKLQAAGIDHASVLVTDLQRSGDFYARVFGLTPARAQLNETLLSLRQQNPPGLIDHFAIRVQGFNRDTATDVLKQHGLAPANNVEFGFHVKDPDGAVVQIV